MYAQSKTLALAAVGLLALTVVFLAGSIALRQQIPDDYIGAERGYLSLLEKQIEEFDSIKTNQRIVLIGSSPVIMGISAGQIENATGVPARNLAMDASRSVFDDYAAMVIEHVRPGDVIIIADPNLRRLPKLQLPLRCVRHFGFQCVRTQSGLRPRLIQDAMVLFTSRSFGDEELPRTLRGDFLFPKKPQFEAFRPKFPGSFPNNGASDMAKLAADVRSRGGCPIFVLTPLLPRPEEIALWQNEFAKLWRNMDQMGLHDIVVEDSPLWNDRALFHHDEHMSERGREVWTRSIIAKLRENGLPGGCGRIDARFQ